MSFLTCRLGGYWEQWVKNVASKSDSSWPSLSPSQASPWISVDIYYFEKSYFIYFGCDMTAAELGRLHCLLWICFIHNNQGCGVVTCNGQASKTCHKSQSKTVFRGSSRLMATFSSLRLGWDLRKYSIVTLAFSLPETTDGLESPGGLWKVPPA